MKTNHFSTGKTFLRGILLLAGLFFFWLSFTSCGENSEVTSVTLTEGIRMKILNQHLVDYEDSMLLFQRSYERAVDGDVKTNVPYGDSFTAELWNVQMDDKGTLAIGLLYQKLITPMIKFCTGIMVPECSSFNKIQSIIEDDPKAAEFPVGVSYKTKFKVLSSLAEIVGTFAGSGKTEAEVLGQNNSNQNGNSNQNTNTNLDNSNNSNDSFEPAVSLSKIKEILNQIDAYQPGKNPSNAVVFLSKLAEVALVPGKEGQPNMDLLANYNSIENEYGVPNAFLGYLLQSAGGVYAITSYDYLISHCPAIQTAVNKFLLGTQGANSGDDFVPRDGEFYPLAGINLQELCIENDSMPKVTFLNQKIKGNLVKISLLGFGSTVRGKEGKGANPMGYVILSLGDTDTVLEPLLNNEEKAFHRNSLFYGSVKQVDYPIMQYFLVKGDITTENENLPLFGHPFIANQQSIEMVYHEDNFVYEILGSPSLIQGSGLIFEEKEGEIINRGIGALHFKFSSFAKGEQPKYVISSNIVADRLSLMLGKPDIIKKMPVEVQEEVKRQFTELNAGQQLTVNPEKIVAPKADVEKTVSTPPAKEGASDGDVPPPEGIYQKNVNPPVTAKATKKVAQGPNPVVDGKGPFGCSISQNGKGNGSFLLIMLVFFTLLAVRKKAGSEL